MENKKAKVNKSREKALKHFRELTANWFFHMSKFTDKWCKKLKRDVAYGDKGYVITKDKKLISFCIWGDSYENDEGNIINENTRSFVKVLKTLTDEEYFDFNTELIKDTTDDEYTLDWADEPLEYDCNCATILIGGTRYIVDYEWNFQIFSQYEARFGQFVQNVAKIAPPSEWQWGCYNHAFQIALQAHRGQVDKVGVPYIEHIKAVSGYAKTCLGTIVGILHDVVEDSSITLEDLEKSCCGLKLGRVFNKHIVFAVDCLTKHEGESIEDYFGRVAKSEIAIEVKLADMRHNSDTSRWHNGQEAEAMKNKAKYFERANLLCRIAGIDEGNRLNYMTEATADWFWGEEVKNYENN